MGDLSKLAKKNSNWLIVNIGESVVVKYLDFKIIPSELDPTKEVVQYKFLDPEVGTEKYWKNGSGRIMNFFDGVEKGKAWVKISRSPWLDKAGKVVEGKSSWVVEMAAEPPKKVEEEKAWDE
jgi:hypothetical protein